MRLSAHRETPIREQFVDLHLPGRAEPHLRLTTVTQTIDRTRTQRTRSLGVYLGSGTYDTGYRHPMVTGAKAVSVHRTRFSSEHSVRIEMPEDVLDMPNERVLRMLGRLADRYNIAPYSFDRITDTIYVAEKLPHMVIDVEAKRGEEISTHRVSASGLIAAGARLAVAETLAAHWRPPANVGP